MYIVVRSSDHWDFSRKSPFDRESLFNEETKDFEKELDEIEEKIQ